MKLLLVTALILILAVTAFASDSTYNWVRGAAASSSGSVVNVTSLTSFNITNNSASGTQIINNSVINFTAGDNMFISLFGNTLNFSCTLTIPAQDRTGGWVNSTTEINTSGKKNVNVFGNFTTNQSVTFAGGDYTDCARLTTNHPGLVVCAGLSWGDVADKPLLFPTSFLNMTLMPNLYNTSWLNITLMPKLFNTSWGNISGIPTLFTTSWANMSNTSEIHGRFIGFYPTVTATAGREFNYTASMNTSLIYVRMIGGGGGGGACTGGRNNASMAAGGGCGSYLEFYANVTPYQNYTFWIGKGGPPGVVTLGVPGPGSAGNESNMTIGTFTYRAFGGNGGGPMNAGATALYSTGGASSILFAGALVYAQGAYGNYGLRNDNATGVSGGGCSSPYGSGGAPKISGGLGNGAAKSSGAGGGGANCMGIGNLSGGTGGDGYITIQEFT